MQSGRMTRCVIYPSAPNQMEERYSGCSVTNVIAGCIVHVLNCQKKIFQKNSNAFVAYQHNYKICSHPMLSQNGHLSPPFLVIRFCTVHFSNGFFYCYLAVGCSATSSLSMGGVSVCLAGPLQIIL